MKRAMRNKENMAATDLGSTSTMGVREVGRRLALALVVVLAALGLAASTASADYGLEFFDVRFVNQDGTPATQSGSHPYAMTTAFEINNDGNLPPLIDGKLRDMVIEQLTGFVGAATLPRCSTADFLATPADRQGQTNLNNCPDSTAIGVVEAEVFMADFGPSRNSPVFNIVPPPGVAARIGFRVRGIPAIIDVVPKDTPGYNIVASALNTSAAAPILSAQVMLFGVPADPAHDFQRGVCVNSNGFRREFLLAPDPAEIGTLTDVYCPSGVAPSALLTLPRSCDSSLETSYRTRSWEQPDNWVVGGVVNHDLPFGVEPTGPLTTQPFAGCDTLAFEPQLAARPTAGGADGASGFSFELDFDQDGLTSPGGRAQSDLKGATVTLPEGLTVNPSSATGLQGCSDAQFALNEGGEPSCPDGSKIGTVEVTSPLLHEELGGEMILLDPKSIDPASGDMFRGGLVIRNTERGVLVKVVGKVFADPNTGRITATFDDNPQLPFDHLEVKVKGGPQGALALPQRCGQIVTSTTMSPWSGNSPVLVNTPFAVGGDCSFGFAPSLDAGMDTKAARSHGDFAFKFSRRDGEQWLRGLTAKLPKGLLASVRDLPLCSNAAANAGACPAGSRIGIVDAKAGSGDPFVLEQKGEIFLTEGYKGGPYGLAVKIRPVAGPFRGAFELSPIIVRQAIHVDRSTAQVTAVSDPFPLIHHGVPLRVREVTVLVDRDRFMLNPSDCAAKQVGADILSAEGATANTANAFQASGCADIAFKPRLGLRLTGRKQVRTGKHPGIRALVRQNGIPEAGIEKAEVRLPKSLALDVDNAQALCEFEDGTKPDLENHCPKGSIVGRARASSPLLNDPLSGNVYFVKNVRIDPETGNEIRTLPMIVVALRGEIAVNLKGESSTTDDGKLVNTFDNVPDAPVSQFNLNIKGGKNGILAVTRTRRSLINLCAKPKSHIAEADMDGQNGRRRDFDVRMKTPCSKRRTRAIKRKAAKRAAAERVARAKRS
jgi:hypothetical protein